MNAQHTPANARNRRIGGQLAVLRTALDEIGVWAAGLEASSQIPVDRLQAELLDHRREAEGYVQRANAERRAAEAADEEAAAEAEDAAVLAAEEADRRKLLAVMQDQLEIDRRRTVREAVDLLGQERYQEFLDWLTALGTRGRAALEALTRPKGVLTEDEIRYRRDGLRYAGPRVLLFDNLP